MYTVTHFNSYSLIVELFPCLQRYSLLSLLPLLLCVLLQCVLFLEKELVALGAMCSASLLKEDTVLPFAGEPKPSKQYRMC